MPTIVACQHPFGGDRKAGVTHFRCLQHARIGRSANLSSQLSTQPLIHSTTLQYFVLSPRASEAQVSSPLSYRPLAIT